MQVYIILRETYVSSPVVLNALDHLKSELHSAREAIRWISQQREKKKKTSIMHVQRLSETEPFIDSTTPSLVDTFPDSAGLQRNIMEALQFYRHQWASKGDLVWLLTQDSVLQEAVEEVNKERLAIPVEAVSHRAFLE